jgi:oxygen-independent coproporphyrinogen-3 oxidase
LGVNRISLGMQSANADDLLLLERQHDFKQVKKAVEFIRTAGFANLNLDLIFGIPFQSVNSFQESLDLALALQPEHFSLYALTIESGTPLESRVRKGMVPEPDPDLAAQMYEMADEKLILKGYEQYEISNWARRDQDEMLLACRHNLQYWRNLPYLGVGAGAHGFAAGMRTENELNPKKYIQVLGKAIERDAESNLSFPQSPATVVLNKVDRELEMKETMMMGLRLTKEGISSTGFKNRFSVELKDVFHSEIEALIALGLLQWVSDPEEKLRLTEGGRLLGNHVFMRFV